MLFTPEEEGRILEAIREAEQGTTGEIRLYVEDFCLADHPVERAVELFQLFGMFNTKARNAVLVYLAEKSRHFAIWGDTGIHDRVGFQFWDKEKVLLRDFLKEGLPAEGVCQVIRQIGVQLKQYFPGEFDEPDNELSNEIIYG